MKFGIELPIEKAGQARSAGFDYIEEDIARLLKPEISDEFWDAPKSIDLPVLAADSLIPESMAVTGPGVDLPALRLHVQRVCERAARVRLRILVLESPASLRIPDGFDPKQAKQQIIEFLRTALPFFARHELMLVAGPNRADKCNILTSLPEVLQYIWAVDHPGFQCLLDIGQVQDGQVSMEQVNDALPWIRHVYVPQDGGEAIPEVRKVLRRYKYDGAVTFKTTNRNPDGGISEASLANLTPWIVD